jgi:hypothetical protein
MTYAKTVVNTNGDKIWIGVDIYVNYGNVAYTVDVKVIPKGKRKEVDPLKEIKDGHEYRAIPFRSRERQEYLLEKLKEWIDKDELSKAVGEAWGSISPDVIGFELRQ